MLKPANNYINEIGIKLQEALLNYESYKYYDLSTGGRNSLKVDTTDENWVVVGINDKVIAFINYYVNTEIKAVKHFGVISFDKSSETKMQLGLALRKIIKMIFTSHNCNYIMWAAHEDNEIIKSYKKVVKRLGGSFFDLRRSRGYGEGEVLFYINNPYWEIIHYNKDPK